MIGRPHTGHLTYFALCSDDQAIAAVKAAIASPRTPSFPLLECDFPPLVALNKLGDGSLSSAQAVDRANLAFCTKLVKELSPLVPGFGPKVFLLCPSTATQSFAQKAAKGGIEVHSLKEGLSAVKSRDICVVVAPSSSRDYDAAKRLAMNGNAVILVNGFAKVGSF
jgi:hypothetical protein